MSDMDRSDAIKAITTAWTAVQRLQDMMGHVRSKHHSSEGFVTDTLIDAEAALHSCQVELQDMAESIRGEA